MLRCIQLDCTSYLLVVWYVKLYAATLTAYSIAYLQLSSTVLAVQCALAV